MSTDTRLREISSQARMLDTPGPGGRRTVEVLAVPFGETLTLLGFAEQISPDVTVTLRDGHTLPMLWRHSEQIGAWDRDLVRGPDGLHATGRISDTTLGRDVATLLADQALSGASIGFRVAQSHSEQHDGRPVEIVDGIELLEISLTPVPAYTGARVESVRERKDPPVTDTLPDLDTLTPRFERLEQADEQLRELLADVRDQIDTPRGTPSALYAYRNLDDFVLAAHDGQVVTRALVDQITPDNPGLVPPGWVSEVRGIVDTGAPCLAALGGQMALPDTGMEINWPYLDPAVDLATLIEQQVAEKNEIASVKVSFLKGSKPIGTLAGGSDISWQLLLRSSPSYREQYLRVMTTAYAMTVDAWIADDLAAEATGSVEGFDPTATDGSLQGAVFAASRAVKNATGSPATVLLAADDVFDALGANPSLVPPVYGTQNVPGTAQASTLEVSISGLPVVNCTALADGTCYATNTQAVGVYGTGPLVATDDDVAKLGTNVAVWGMLAPIIFTPAGVVALTPTVVTP